MNLDYWVLVFVMEKPNGEAHSKYLGNLSLPKDIRNGLRRYWVNMVHFLKNVKLYEAIFASLFSHDCHASMIRAFCERWCPTTNTLHNSIREVSISLWDLYRIVKLPIIGSFYDEMVSSAEELSGNKVLTPTKLSKFIPCISSNLL